MAVRGRTGIFPHHIDQTTDCNSDVDYEHKEVHNGDCFYKTFTSELATNGVLSIRLQTPNTTKWSHLMFQIASQGHILIQIRETITDNFGAGAAFNRNRNYADALVTTKLESSAGAATAGTVIWSWNTGGVIASAAEGNSPLLVRAEEEIVLKQNEKYELRITSLVDDNTVNAYVNWYEHTNIE